MPADLSGKTVVKYDYPRECRSAAGTGVRVMITTTPRYEGRSFGTNATEAMLTAYAGKGRPLSNVELDDLIDELNLHPTVQWLNR
jgi:hypothetical protein